MNEELNRIGEQLLAQKSPEKEQSSRAIEEISKKLVALEEQESKSRHLLKESVAREEGLLEKARTFAVAQKTLEVGVYFSLVETIFVR